MKLVSTIFICAPIMPAALLLLSASYKILPRTWVLNETFFYGALIVFVSTGTFALYRYIVNVTDISKGLICAIYFTCAMFIGYILSALTIYYTFAAGGKV